VSDTFNLKQNFIKFKRKIYKYDARYEFLGVVVKARYRVFVYVEEKPKFNFKLF